MYVTLSIMFFVILVCTIAVPIVGFYFFATYKLFEKCGIDGWKGLIPGFNKYIEIQIAGVHWWYILIYIGSFFLYIDGKTGIKILCVLMFLFVHSIISYNLVKRINNDKNPLILDFMLLTFLPLVYLPIIALNDDFKYKPDVEVTPNAYIDEIQTSNFNRKEKKKTNLKKRYCEKCGEPLAIKDIFCPHCGKKI